MNRFLLFLMLGLNVFGLMGCSLEEEEDDVISLSDKEIEEILEEFGENPSENANENEQRVQAVIQNPNPGVTRGEGATFN
jgi:hypothetical protein